MRRRSERKKSTDVSSPAARRGRRRKSPSISENEKNADEYADTGNTDSQNRASSEEPLAEKGPRRRRNSRRRTPVNENSTPSKRSRSRHAESPEISKIGAIPEEENGAVGKTSTNNKIQDSEDERRREDVDGSEHDSKEVGQKETIESVDEAKDELKSEADGEEVTKKTEVTAEQICKDGSEKEVIGNSRSLSPKGMVEEKSKTSDVLDIKEDSEEVGQYEDNDGVEMRSFASITNEKRASNDSESGNFKKGNESSTVKTKTEIETEVARIIGDDNETKIQSSKLPHKEQPELDSNENSVIKISTNSIESAKLVDVSGNHAEKSPQKETVRIRKRKWLTKKSEIKVPILAISTDSLKGLISDVHPVPLSDVRLDSSPEVEEVASEREEGEETPTPERREEREEDSIEKVLEKPAVKRTPKEPIITVPVAAATGTVAAVVPNATVHLQRSPSPPRNKTSHVLYITNLVRPFTVLQLKGLLARTGKIVEDGFWIDRIKSKCYVEYETEDEAIETRHALHGVRWPVSNPKCLNVDFGSRADMQRAIDSTKEDGPKLGQDNKDNLIIGTGWNRGERYDDIDRKSVRPVREWDVGKKENLEREKTRDIEKRRSRERERERERDRGRERDRERERDNSANRENEKINDRKSRNRGRERSHSMSPARKIIKKENEPPLRLLDDLFRKTKASPCVYWLPLTPEQIAEKEAFRQKKIQEHQERVKQRELERETDREKEREKDRNRGSDRDRDRRNRSNDRRRSRSRDRRRY